MQPPKFKKGVQANQAKICTFLVRNAVSVNFSTVRLGKKRERGVREWSQLEIEPENSH